MGNTLETKFIYNDSQNAKIAGTVSLLEKANALANRLSGQSPGQNPTFGTNALTAPSFKPIDAELNKAKSAVADFEKSRVSLNKSSLAAIESGERALTRIKISEAKAANNAAIEEIKKRTRAEKESTGSGFGSTASLVIGAGVAFGAKFLKDSVEASFDAERANRKLTASATEAGLAYGVLAEKNKQFAASAGLSETAATNITAKIAQLATFGGRPQDIDKLQKSFLDLSAAKGIDSKDIDTLIGTILSGQDEGLNRLGISDPGQLYKAYAKEIGTTADKLSQFQKVQAATNAVVEKAAIFNGANADKLNSVSGQAEKAKANLDNFYTNVGTGITQTMEFRDAVGFLSEAFAGLSLNLTSVREQLAKGLTPKQIAEKNADGFGAEVLDALKDGTGLVGGLLAYLPDAATDGFSVANRRLFESGGGARNRRIASDTAAIEAEKKQLDRQGKDAEEQKQKLGDRTFATAFQSKIDSLVSLGSDGVSKIKIQAKDIEAARRELNANLDKLSETEYDKAKTGLIAANRKFLSERATAAEKRFSRDPSLDDARFNLAALNSIKKALPEEQFESFSDKLNDFIKNDLQKTDDKIKEIRKTTLSAFDDLSRKLNRDNPVALAFADGRKELEALKESLRGLSPELQNQAFAVQKKLNDSAVFNARLNNDFAAFDLKERAGDLRGFKTPKIDDQSKFFNDFISDGLKQIASENGGGGLRFNLTGGKDFTFGFSQSSPDPLKKYNSNIFTDGVNSDGSPRQFTNGFSQSEINPLIRYNSNIFTDKNGKQFTNGFSQSNLSFNDLTEKEKNDFINKDNLSLQEKLSRSFDLAGNRSALNDDQQSTIDRKILSLSSSFRPEQLNDRQRDIVATAAENEARRRSANEDKGLHLQTRIAEELTKLREIAEKDGFKSLEQTLRIINESDAEVDFLPARPQ